jgi:23S rRNA (uracil1939-C5)-methyltransferase
VSQIELVIESLAAGGDGVGRDADGRVTFVPYTAPGERVRAALVEEHKSFARADLIEVLEPSPARVDPPCPAFAARTCGGCQWQHLAAGAQAAAKQAIVAAALRRFVADGLELAPIATPVAPLHWRRRARLHWVESAQGTVIGFYAPGSRRVTPIDRCVQLDRALAPVLALLGERLAGGLRRRGEIELLVGEGAEVHVAIHGPCDPARVEALVGHAGVVGVAVGRRQSGAERIALEDGLLGRADRFAQASREGNAALGRAVVELCQPLAGAQVVELHAGSGNFTRKLAAAGAEVVAVERQPGPVVDRERVRWRVGVAERVLTAMVRSHERYDLAVLDPPRQGARELCAALVELAPPRVVYVACDPATLARDLAVLVDGGYRAARAQALDLMPQTAHVEVVVALARAHSGA